MLSKEDIVFILELFTLKKRSNEIELRIGSFNTKQLFNPNLTQEQYDVFVDKLGIVNKNPVIERSIVFTNNSGLRKVIILTDDNKNKSSYIEQKSKIKIHDMPNLGVRLALSNEAKVSSSNTAQYNFLRYKNRQSVISDDKNWKYDITKVISKKLGNISQASDIVKEILNDSENYTEYNVEIELINEKIDKEEFLDSLTRQLNIIKSPEEAKHDSLKHIIYTKMYNLIKENRWKNYTFRDFISQPITMQLKDLGTIETEEYATTEKADGQRHLLFVDCSDESGTISSSCKGYLINNTDTITPISIGLKNSSIKNIIIDGELITLKDNTKIYATFDIIVFDDEDISTKDLRHRFNKLKEFIAMIGKSSVKIIIKDQLMVETNKPEDIYKLNSQVLSKKFPYKTDGLILTPINEKYYNNTTFKWKPIHETTIDFLIKRIKVNKNTIEYHLYVGITKGDFNLYNLRHDKEYPLLFPKINLQTALYFPTLFTPYKVIEELPKNLHIACLPRKLDLPDDIIVELYYDTGEVSNASGTSSFPWKFRNIREDKTEEYKKYNNNFGNTWKTAYTNLIAILRPVTEEIIRGSSKAPFFLPEADKETSIKSMRKFHNHVKAVIYSDYVKNKEWLLEVASGKLADLHRWINNKIKNIVALDVDVQAVEEGARRIEAKRREIGEDKFPNIYLGVADALNEWLPAIKETIQLDKTPQFDVIAIQFALHFFLKSDTSLDALIANIYTNLKKNGIFIATALDGEAVKKLLDLNNIKEGETLSLKKQYQGKNKTIIGIKRDFSSAPSTELKEDNSSTAGIIPIDQLSPTGQEISVYIDSIGTYHKEYLVNFEYLIKMFEKAKFKLVKYEGFEKFYNSKKYPMSESELIYSFMNRVIIFKKK